MVEQQQESSENNINDVRLTSDESSTLAWVKKTLDIKMDSQTKNVTLEQLEKAFQEVDITI